eukprot:PITA_06033
MVEEYDSIARNSAWEIVPKPEGKLVVGSRWIYKVKQETDGSVGKYKARFVARGFSQIEGIDYEEIFAPIARLKRGTSRYELDEVKLCGFMDADWAGSSRGRLYGSKGIRYHHIKDCVQQRIMLLSYIPTKDQDADILTKALTRIKFEYH